MDSPSKKEQTPPEVLKEHIIEVGQEAAKCINATMSTDIQQEQGGDGLNLQASSHLIEVPSVLSATAPELEATSHLDTENISVKATKKQSEQVTELALMTSTAPDLQDIQEHNPLVLEFTDASTSTSQTDFEKPLVLESTVVSEPPALVTLETNSAEQPALVEEPPQTYSHPLEKSVDLQKRQLKRKHTDSLDQSSDVEETKQAKKDSIKCLQADVETSEFTPCLLLPVLPVPDTTKLSEDEVKTGSVQSDEATVINAQSVEDVQSIAPPVSPIPLNLISTSESTEISVPILVQKASDDASMEVELSRPASEVKASKKIVKSVGISRRRSSIFIDSPLQLGSPPKIAKLSRELSTAINQAVPSKCASHFVEPALAGSSHTVESEHFTSSALVEPHEPDVCLPTQSSMELPKETSALHVHVTSSEIPVTHALHPNIATESAYAYSEIKPPSPPTSGSITETQHYNLAGPSNLPALDFGHPIHSLQSDLDRLATDLKSRRLIAEQDNLISDDSSDEDLQDERRNIYRSGKLPLHYSISLQVLWLLCCFVVLLVLCVFGYLAYFKGGMKYLTPDR